MQGGSREAVGTSLGNRRLDGGQRAVRGAFSMGQILPLKGNSVEGEPG